MIKTKEGKTKLEGTAVDLLAEYSCITKDLYEVFVKNGFTEEQAKKDIQMAFDVAFCSKEEIEEKLKESIKSHFLGFVDDLFSRKEE